MPVVPFAQPAPSQPTVPDVDPIYLAMAAGEMYSMGRLFEPIQKAPDAHSE